VIGLLLLILGWPSPAGAQIGGEVGVVTTLSGRATVARVVLPRPLPLKFKDGVFVRDRISTAENSLVRVLLGGKALVTARELSVLMITEEMGRSTVSLEAGKIGVAVSRPQMRAGEAIEIRTPHAIAAVRGTVLVVEIIKSTATAAGPEATKIHVLKGAVDVSSSNAPEAPAVRVGTLQTVTVSGDAVGEVRRLSASESAQVTGDLQPPEPPHTELGQSLKQEIGARAQARAAALVQAIVRASGGGADDGSPGADGHSGEMDIALLEATGPMLAASAGQTPMSPTLEVGALSPTGSVAVTSGLVSESTVSAVTTTTATTTTTTVMGIATSTTATTTVTGITGSPTTTTSVTRITSPAPPTTTIKGITASATTTTTNAATAPSATPTALTTVIQPVLKPLEKSLRQGVGVLSTTAIPN
jgi:hypothetical protein